MIPITINGNTYTSIAQAWRETGCPIPLITVRARLKAGWAAEDAFTVPALPARVRYTGEYRYKT